MAENSKFIEYNKVVCTRNWAEITEFFFDLDLLRLKV